MIRRISCNWCGRARGGRWAMTSSASKMSPTASCCLRARCAKCRGQGGAVFELADPRIAALHRPAHVEEQVQVHVRFGVELLHVQAIRAGEQLPIDVPQVVPLGIFAVRGELDRKPDERTPVQAVHKPFDDAASPQLEVIEPREEDGIGELAGIEGHGIQGQESGVSEKTNAKEPGSALLRPVCGADRRTSKSAGLAA